MAGVKVPPFNADMEFRAMPIPEKHIKYYEKDLLEHALDNVAAGDDPLSPANRNKVATAAQVQMGIDLYRMAAKGMSEDQLLGEGHNSAVLGFHLEQAYGPRPPRCHAHALVAGKHRYAAELRLLMAILKIRIDNVDNGCWLPENTAATPHPSFPGAPPHSRIHRYNYFFWIFSRLGNLDDEGLFRTNLKVISDILQQGHMPHYVLLPKGVGLPTNGIRF